jgi:hypothetical protein
MSCLSGCRGQFVSLTVSASVISAASSLVWMTGGGARPGRAGLRQCCGAGQGAGLAVQYLQIVVQVKDFRAVARCAKRWSRRSRRRARRRNWSRSRWRFGGQGAQRDEQMGFAGVPRMRTSLCAVTAVLLGAARVGVAGADGIGDWGGRASRRGLLRHGAQPRGSDTGGRLDGGSGSLVDHFGHAVVFMLRASVHRSLVAVRVDPFCVVNHSGAVGTDVKVC